MPLPVVTERLEQQDPVQDQDIILNEEEEDYDDYDDYLDDELNDADMWDSATGGMPFVEIYYMPWQPYLICNRFYQAIQQTSSTSSSYHKQSGPSSWIEKSNGGNDCNDCNDSCA